MNEERNKFGGWEPTGKPGEYRASMITGPATPDFENFAEQSRARWDVGEWVKVKLKQLLDKRTPAK